MEPPRVLCPLCQKSLANKKTLRQHWKGNACVVLKKDQTWFAYMSSWMKEQAQTNIILGMIHNIQENPGAPVEISSLSLGGQQDEVHGADKREPIEDHEEERVIKPVQSIFEPTEMRSLIHLLSLKKNISEEQKNEIRHSIPTIPDFLIEIWNITLGVPVNPPLTPTEAPLIPTFVLPTINQIRASTKKPKSPKYIYWVGCAAVMNNTISFDLGENPIFFPTVYRTENMMSVINTLININEVDKFGIGIRGLGNDSIYASLRNRFTAGTVGRTYPTRGYSFILALYLFPTRDAAHDIEYFFHGYYSTNRKWDVSFHNSEGNVTQRGPTLFYIVLGLHQSTIPSNQ